MEQASGCWCGNGDLAPFSPAYQKCSACETLVVTQMPGPGISRVTNDEQDFYGREYWFSYQERELGNPNIIVRSRTDLPERCLHWLRTVLKYKLPPARILELGSAHGGFVALLRWAGFEASGLELSPWAVEFARQTFGVPILRGPVEDQRIESGCLDVIVLMDVLEHLPDPVDTMRRCAELLKADGILLIQTPCFPGGNHTYEQLFTDNDPFATHLEKKEKGHLFLFTQASVRLLMERVGCSCIVFEPAIFEYDMFFVASKMEAKTTGVEDRDMAMMRLPSSRLVQALIDRDDNTQELLKCISEIENDRQGRIQMIATLNQHIEKLSADYGARLQVILEQQATIATLNQHIEKLSADYGAYLQAMVKSFFSRKKPEA